MIRFKCQHCGTDYTVKPEFAGRATSCRICKHPLAVPALPEQTFAVPEHMEGPSSSLGNLGQGVGVTLAEVASEGTLAGNIPETLCPAPGHVGRTVSDILAAHASHGQRYLIEGEIARGGMGAVLRGIDCDLRREIAVKYLLDSTDPHKSLRFIEEAQITGQLEHPNIVPIHELGLDAQKRLFIAMKMVKGRSLAEVFDFLRNDPLQADKQYPLSRLLSILVSACHAVGYAHSRGVVHRDLKPANIMVGDFGEVYVMDWGLAKVLTSRVTERPDGDTTAGYSKPPLATVVESTGGTRPPLATTIVTDRMLEVDLTQEGTILGTPLYMPPEQAIGHVAEINPRSDIYALGAILYEMLTLQPPVEREGGHIAILTRVIEGRIVPPHQRLIKEGKAPSRWVSSELSAIAMKALAREPVHRYPSTEDMRRDLERYQEGRSVSAKDDTKWEVLVKFVKRNRGFSGATAAALLVLTIVLFISFKVNYQARLKAENNYTAYLKAETEKRENGKQSVPALTRAARFSASEKHYDDAMRQVNAALEYDADYPDARLLRGQLFIVEGDYGKARDELERYTKQRPNDEQVTRLIALCNRATVDDVPTLAAIADVFYHQQATSLAEKILDQIRGLQEGQNRLLDLYRQRIATAWKRTGKSQVLSEKPDRGLHVTTPADVKDLEPLRGIPLKSLQVYHSPIQDLSPLHGMPLSRLSLSGVQQLRDLSPLRGMDLDFLAIYRAEGLEDLRPLEGMKLTALILRGCKSLGDLTPLKNIPLIELDLYACSKVKDLSPLQGMPLSRLNLGSTRVYDLTQISGLPLSVLSLSSNRVIRDLSPLEGMSLTSLYLDRTTVNDLTPLAGMELEHITLPDNIAKGMQVLRNMTSLETINDVPAVEFWKRHDAKKDN